MKTRFMRCFTIAITTGLFGFTLAASAATSRKDTVVDFVKQDQSQFSKEILAQADIRKELALSEDAKSDVGFRFDLAFQEAQLKPSVSATVTASSELIEDGNQVVIPFCSAKICIVTVFDEDEESGQLELVSFGSSSRAARLVTGFQTLNRLRPGFKGDVKFVEYPAGKLDFLVLDGKFMPTTEDQAVRLQVSEREGSLFMSPSTLAAKLDDIDAEARRTSVAEGLDEKSTRSLLTSSTSDSSVTSQPDDASPSAKPPVKMPASKAFRVTAENSLQAEPSQNRLVLTLLSLIAALGVFAGVRRVRLKA